MSDQLKTSEKRKIIASVTLLLVENREGVRYCDTVSSLDESTMTPYDTAKFQFHCVHWFAALHQIVVRKLVHQNDVLVNELKNHAEALKQIEQRLDQANSGTCPFGGETE